MNGLLNIEDLFCDRRKYYLHTKTKMLVYSSSSCVLFTDDVCSPEYFFRTGDRSIKLTV